MRRNPFGLFFVALLFVGPTACKANPEERAATEIKQAKAFYEQAELDRAEKVFRHVQEAYSGTRSAREAGVWLTAIERKREDLLRERTLQVLGRIREVVEGYRTVHGRYPATVHDLDHSNYIFDSKYLAEVVPSDFTVFLAFDENSRSYRGWAWRKGESRGYLLNPAVEGFIPFSDPRLVKDLLARGGETLGNLICFQGDIGAFLSGPT